MKCPKCQFDNPEAMKFCGECGAKLEIICSKCNFLNPPQFKYCGECGHNLAPLQKAPPIDYAQPESYTPKFLADKILTTRSSIEGERKLVTVLFADVAGYTSLSENLDPEEVHRIMDGCFKILMEEIHKYEGTINQFTGDGIMALFGAPVAHEDHAQRACFAALTIQKGIGVYGQKIKNDFGVDFKMRLGLNSGPVIVGSIGDDLRMDYTAVGDTTNLASRIENIARPGTILVSSHTHKLAKDFFEFKSVGKVEVKGKAELQEAFELIKIGRARSRIEASVAKGLTHFVGRKKSMAALMGVYEKTQSGSGQIVGVVGDAGVGKSRLMLEFKNQLLQDDIICLEGRCLHFGSAMAYMPILDILRSYFEIKEGDQEDRIKKNMEEKLRRLDRNLLGVLPPLHELLSLEVKDDTYQKLEPMQKREKTFEAIRNLLVRESQNRSIFLIVEDLHWIDKTSEEFVGYLIEWLANSRILLILLYRPEYTHPWGSKSNYNRIGLNHLSSKSSTELIQAILREGDPVPELRELILQRAAGNPLYMEEFTHTLLENGSIVCRNHKCELIKKASEIQVPDTVQGIIAARMDRLEDNLKRTMQVASVIGRDFAFRVLETISEMREELNSCLLKLQGLEFIYEKSLFPELEYVFKHALTQEVAYNSLLQKRRIRIHENIGIAIEALWPHRLKEFYEMLAYHYSKGENYEKAYQYLKLSGNKAAGNYSNQEALSFYKEAMVLLAKMAATRENKTAQIEVNLLAAITMFVLNFPDGSLEVLREGEKLSNEIGDEKSLSHFLSLIGQYYGFKGGDLLLGIKYSEDSFKAAEKIDDVDLMIPIGIDLCILYWRTGEFFKLIQLASKLFTLFDKTQKQAESFKRPYNVYSMLIAYYAQSIGMLGDFEKGSVLIEKGLSVARGLNDLNALALLESHYGTMLTFKGDAKNAVAHFQNCIRYCEDGQFVVLSGIASVNLGWAYCLIGKFNAALQHIENGFKIQIDSGANFHLCYFYRQLSLVHLESGNLKNAQLRAEEALKLSQRNYEKWDEGLAWILLGRIYAQGAETLVEKAEKCILQGIKILEEMMLKPLYASGYCYLGQFYANTGHRDKALENLEKSGRMFREMGMDYWDAKTKELLERLQTS